MEIIITTNRWKNDPNSRQLVEYLQANEAQLSLEQSILYYDFPSYADYDASTFRPDVLIFSPSLGFVAVRFLDSSLFQRSSEGLEELDAALDDFVGNLHSRLVKSRLLRKGRTDTIVQINSAILHLDAKETFDTEDVESAVCNTLPAFGDFLKSLLVDPLEKNQAEEVRSVVEGAKALSRTAKRKVSDSDAQPLAKILSDVEGEIANFDEKQRHIALVDVGGPARIRGLAGSGKTVILAMKAAHLHLNDPNARILFTFYTKSLRSTIKSLIAKFFRIYSDSDPDWKKIQIRHGWGGRSIPGVYSDACGRISKTPLTLPDARRISKPEESPFGAICRELLETGRVEPFYDHVLIDEGQDFPDSFYKLAYQLTKGERDKKSLVWAYDELQDIMNVEIRQPKELFGVDASGTPYVDLDRSSGAAPPGARNDAVLSRAYRNQRDVLISAHSLGFGVYGNIVQMLESAEHWEDVGYEVLSGPLKIGSDVEVRRPDQNSPISISDIPDFNLIDGAILNGLAEECEWIATEVERFIGAGLNPEDILVISLDDRHARSYFRKLTTMLSERGISSNNVIADPYNEPPFTIANKVTLSTVYRAKGNEAAVVFALGVESVSLRTRDGRNKLFTAFTRTKAWLRVSGIASGAKQVAEELKKARENSPYIRFEMPDPAQIDTIQRGFSKKQQIAQAARKKYLESLRKAGFSEEEIEEELNSSDVIE
ncbi:DEAD/DEAH box helicase [Ruegeria faecimaris]|uniref:DEAD/DEAH box helicase n=1 Tax=Ruegeria faecimaris TaxID=686389 RepID=UPI002491D2EF|nr:ATP-binding domain-containing protein [Ruegeria faecimaris]